MELECRVVKRNGESFLYRKYNDTAYLSKAANPGIILQKKRYECGLIEREDFVNNRFSSIPSHMRKDAVVFKIKDNNLLITGKLKKGKMASLGDFILPEKKQLTELNLGPIAKRFLNKTVKYIKNMI